MLINGDGVSVSIVVIRGRVLRLHKKENFVKGKELSSLMHMLQVKCNGTVTNYETVLTGSVKFANLNLSTKKI